MTKNEMKAYCITAGVTWLLFMVAFALRIVWWVWEPIGHQWWKVGG